MPVLYKGHTCHCPHCTLLYLNRLVASGLTRKNYLVCQIRSITINNGTPRGISLKVYKDLCMHYPRTNTLLHKSALFIPQISIRNTHQSVYYRTYTTSVQNVSQQSITKHEM